MPDGITEPRGFENEPHDKRQWFRSIFQWVQRRTKVVNKTAAYTVEADVYLVRVDCTSGAVTITLPPSSRWGGREIAVIKIDGSANAVTVAASSGDAVNGDASLGAQWDAARAFADGTTNWDIL